jgi:hypothetical protein
MTRLWWLALLGLLLGPACEGTDDDDSGVGDDDDATADDDDADDDAADDDTADDDDTAPPDEPYVVGYVQDVTCTEYLPGIRVTFCQDEQPCAFLDTDEDGRYLLDGLAGGTVGQLHVAGHINADMELYSAVVGEVDVPEAGFVEAQTACLPKVAQVLPLEGGMQTIEAGDGLTLTLDPDDTIWIMGEPQLGAVEVPPTAWQYMQVEGVEMLGVWGTYMWGATSETPIPVTMPMRGNVDCGTDEVTVYVMSDEESAPVAVGPAVLDCNLQTVSLAEGEGLHELTWVSFGRPE